MDALFRRCLLACVAQCGLAAAAMAQFAGGVNIDFNSTAGAGAGQPTILFGGAAFQTGFWNPVNGPYVAGTSRTIRNLTNTADAVTLTFESLVGTNSFSFNNAATSGDTELLIDDLHDIGTTGPTLYSIGPFAGGVYDVYTYAVAPDNAAARTGVSVYTSSTGPAAAQSVGGTMPAGGSLVQFITHSAHRIAVARGERIYIQAQGTNINGSINGIQIRPTIGYTRLFVNALANPTIQTGLTWGEACTSVQRALSIAADNPAVSEIWITGGPYRPDDGVLFSTGDRDATFSPRSNLTLIGGFVGVEATPEERNNFGAATQLSGANLARHVVTLNNVSNVLFRDLNINNGNNDLPIGSTATWGPGITALNSSFTASKVRFANNRTDNGGGGAIALFDSTFIANDCDTTGNAANSYSFLAASRSSVTLHRCKIGNNSSTNGSGGVIGAPSSLGTRSTFTLNNCIIANNQHASFIIDASAAATLNLFNCTLANNRSTIGPFVGIATPPSTTIRNCIIHGNAKLAGTPTINDVFFTHAGDVLNISDNIIQGWTGSPFGIAPAFLNFDADPRFRFPSPAGLLAAGDVLGAGQYTLDSRSPARDSGWNDVAPAGVDGNNLPRIFDDPYFPNTGFAGGTVDRGCYEAQSASLICPGDLGSQGGAHGADGLRDNNDFVVFIDYFFTPDSRADVGRSGGLPGADGLYDNNDFVVFIDLFFTTCL